jgi:hypothetical protein
MRQRRVIVDWVLREAVDFYGHRYLQFGLHLGCASFR